MTPLNVPAERRPLRLAIVASHAIQYFCPQYAFWAKGGAWEQRVFFASKAGAEEYFDPEFGHNVSWAGLGLHRFDHTFLNDGQVLPIERTLDAPDLDDALARFDPDVVLAYGYWLAVGRRAQRWAHEHGRRVLMFSDSNPRDRRPLALRLAKRMALRSIYAKVDGFLTTGDANETYHRQHGAADEHLYRCPYPILREELEAAYQDRDALRVSCRAALQVEDSLVVLSIGKLIPRKRQQDLIRAVGALRDGPPVKLVLIGSGGDEAMLRALADAEAPGRVIFVGFVPPEDVPQYLAAADVYVQASDQEAYGIAVTEAAYLGCPLVISDRCGCFGPTSDAQPGRNAWVYPCGDVPALAASLRRLIVDPALRASFAAASREVAVQNQKLSYERGMLHALRGLGFSVPEPRHAG